MRNVVVYEFMTLDGVVEGIEGFFTGQADDDLDDRLAAAVIASQDAVILGRRSFDLWATFWPTAQIEPFASFVNSVPKYVATSTPLATEWAGSRVIDGDLVAFVRDLKAQPGRDIGVHASISVAQALLTAGVVDELRLVVAPGTAGAGRRLLDGVPPVNLTLLAGLTSSTGNLLLHYRVDERR